MKQNGGYATLGQLYQTAPKIPGSTWGTKTPFATIRRIVQQHDEFFKIRPGQKRILPSCFIHGCFKDGLVWIGFSRRSAFDIGRCGEKEEYYDGEQGAYRYDGKIWMHFTRENGLIDNKICAITIDANDNIWFGSFDKGVSRFDGQTWTSYVVP